MIYLDHTPEEFIKERSWNRDAVQRFCDDNELTLNELIPFMTKHSYGLASPDELSAFCRPHNQEYFKGLML